LAACRSAEVIAVHLGNHQRDILYPCEKRWSS
jgi:hypothetical protein